MLDVSVTVSNGGGSSQVMLPPTERETLIEWRFCHDDLNDDIYEMFFINELSNLSR